MSASTDYHAPSGKIIRAHQVHFANGNRVSAPESASPPAQTKEPKITLVKDGDSVTAIEVQCGCGQVIRLDCQY